MLRNKKLVLILFLVLSAFFTIGARLKDGMSLDFTRIYDCVNVSDIVESYENSKDIAKNTYNNRNLLVVGEVVSFDTDKQTALIKGIDSSSSTTIECSFKENPIRDGIPVKSVVNIYGTLSFSMMGKLELNHTKLSQNKVQNLEDYAIASIDNDTIYRSSNMKNRSFTGETAIFYIPKEF